MFFFMTLRQFMQERSSPSEGAFADSYQLESREEQQRSSFSARRYTVTYESSFLMTHLLLLFYTSRNYLMQILFTCIKNY